MRKWLDIYFGFSRREFNGLMVLVVIIGLVMLFPYAYSLMKTEVTITAAEQNAILQLARVDKQKILHVREYKRTNDWPGKARKTELFVFDPNAIGQEDWEKLGLSAKQAQAILRYSEKGGKFRKKEDLQRMYTISSQMYKKLAPYVSIADREGVNGTYKQAVKTKYVKPEHSIIELNGADTTALDKIKGIGMVFANRIVKYRERLGGFYKKEQLMEVFGLDSVKYNEVKDQVTLDLSKLKKISINTAGADDFRNHPYIRYKQVNALIQYRKQHGNYSNIADLNKVLILNQETISRLAPYLEF